MVRASVTRVTEVDGTLGKTKYLTFVELFLAFPVIFGETSASEMRV